MKLNILIALVGLTTAIRLGALQNDEITGTEDNIEHTPAPPEGTDTSKPRDDVGNVDQEEKSKDKKSADDKQKKREKDKEDEENDIQRAEQV